MVTLADAWAISWNGSTTRVHRHSPHPLVFALAAVLGRPAGGAPWAVACGRCTIILSAVGWTGIYRLGAPDTSKHRSREYVRAAEAIGASHASRMFTQHPAQHQPRGAGAAEPACGGLHQAEVILSHQAGRAHRHGRLGTMLSGRPKPGGAGQVVATGCRHLVHGHRDRISRLLTDALRDALDPKLR